ncbi:MAG: hypothetical protein ABIP20_14665 [Chthoniobacteraceae bacterium]
MRFFAIICFAVAMFYGWTAVDAMRTGTVHALGGKSDAEQRRDDPQSKYQRYMLARWLYAGGFAALGGVMLVFAGRFEKLGSDAGK